MLGSNVVSNEEVDIIEGVVIFVGTEFVLGVHIDFCDLEDEFLGDFELGEWVLGLVLGDDCIDVLGFTVLDVIIFRERGDAFDLEFLGAVELGDFKFDFLEDVVLEGVGDGVLHDDDLVEEVLNEAHIVLGVGIIEGLGLGGEEVLIDTEHFLELGVGAEFLVALVAGLLVLSTHIHRGLLVVCLRLPVGDYFVLRVLHFLLDLQQLLGDHH